MRKSLRYIILFILLLSCKLVHSQPLSLIYPPDAYYSDTTSITFTWNAFPGAGITYDLQIATDSFFSSNVQNFQNLSSSSGSVTTLSLGQKYFWHIRGYDGTSYTSWSNYRKFFVFDASVYSSSLKLWLNANKGVTAPGNNVSEWSDMSGNNYDCSQSTGSLEPTWTTNALNGKPVIWFDGSDDRLDGGTISGIDNSSLSCFIVGSGDNVSYADCESTIFCVNSALDIGRNTNSSWANYMVRNQGNYLFGSSLYSSVGSLPLSGYNYKIFGYFKQLNVNSELYFNGSLNASMNDATNTGSFTNNNYSVGTGTFFYQCPYKGNIAEIIIYGQLLSASAKYNVEQYLRFKYAKQINLNADIIIPYGFKDTILDAGSGFTNYSWSTGDASQSISVNKSGTYAVQAKDLFDYTTGDTITVAYPVTKLNYSDTVLCQGSNLILTSLIPNPSKYKYTWSTGDTLLGHNVTASGDYWVKIKDSLGYIAYSDTIHVTIDTIASLIDLGPDTSFCSGNYIHVINQLPNPQSLTYTWTGGTHDTILVINSTGEYKVTVTDTFGCSGRDSIHVTVYGAAPTALFISDTVCFGDSTHFTDLSTPADSVVKWHWQFTLADTSNLKNPVHLFDQPGGYNVTLTAYAHGGCFNAYSHNVIVTPVPAVEFNCDTACMGSPYQFSDQSVAPSGDSIISWSWDFGDPTSGTSNYSTLQHPAHLFASAANYNISLTVYTFHGCSASLVKSLHVVSSLTAPAVPYPDLPYNGYYTADTNIYFHWLASLNAVLYKIIIAADINFTTIIDTIYTDSTHASYIFNNVGQTVYWKVIAYNSCSNSSVSPVFYFHIFSPHDLSGLKLWLMGDAGVTAPGNNVSHWDDMSGNNYDCGQLNGNSRPVFIPNALNNKPAISFDGSDDLLNGTTITGLDNSSLTCFIVASGDNVAAVDANTAMFSVGTNMDGFDIGRNTKNGLSNYMVRNQSMFFGGAIQTSPNSLPASGYRYKIFGYTKEAGINSTLYINAKSKATSQDLANIGFFTNGDYSLGAGSLSFQSPFKGKIAEIIIYNSLLTNTDRKAVEQYLHDKYAGPPVNLGPDINIPYGFCDTLLDAGARFTHYLWSTNDTTQTIIVNHSGTYWVQATDIFDTVSTDTIHVNYPNIAVHDTAVCINSTAHLQTGLGPGYTYLWSTGATTSDLYTGTAGSYKVTITDTLGCAPRIDSAYVTIDSFALHATLGPDRTACRGELLGLAPGSPPAVTYQWSNYTYNSFIVITDSLQSYAHYSVTVTNANGCLASDTIIIFVRGDIPIVSFSSDSVCFGLPTHLIDHTTASPPDSLNTWLWVFGGGGSSTQKNPMHVFGLPGSLQTSLTVTTDSGCYKTLSKQVIVWGNPQVDFSPPNGCTNLAVPFHDLSTNAFGTNSYWHWNFGDAGQADTSLLQHPSYAYDTAGNYNVQLIVTSAAGCTDTITKNILIRNSLHADFSYTHSCAGEKIYFADITVTQPWESIIYRKWLFGDGDTSLSPTPTHFYDTAGSYTVTMIIQSMNGCVAIAQKIIEVYPLPVAGIVSANLCSGVPAQVMDGTVSSDPLVEWLWSFQGLGSSNAQDPFISPPDTGILNASLIVMTSHGCGDTAYHVFHVYPTPHAAYSFNPEFGPSPLDVNFYNASTYDVAWQWSFGDGATASTENAEHTYTSDGIYQAMLTVYSPYGCIDTVTQLVYVMPLITDVSVTRTYATISNHLLMMEADIKNTGQSRISKLNLGARFNGSNTIMEHWTGSITSGESMHYIFSASFETPTYGTIDYACVQAVIPGFDPDDDPSNNEMCEVLNDAFIVSDIYPNPSAGSINMDIIVPFADDVSVVMYNAIGEKVVQLFSGSVPKGYNTFSFDISQYKSGVYGVRIIFHDKREVRKFVRR